jgi:hypothetical protein
VEVVTTEHRASFQFDCAHGTVDGPIRLEADGSFEASGGFVLEHGGPVREDEREEVQPAVYAGRLEGSRLTFTVRLPSQSSTIGTFTAVMGASPRLVRCL